MTLMIEAYLLYLDSTTASRIEDYGTKFALYEYLHCNKTIFQIRPEEVDSESNDESDESKTHITTFRLSTKNVKKFSFDTMNDYKEAQLLFSILEDNRYEDANASLNR